MIRSEREIVIEKIKEMSKSRVSKLLIFMISIENENSKNEQNYKHPKQKE